jgi:transposase
MQAITTIGLDIAKSVFQVHGVDAAGNVVVRRQLKRHYVLAFFQETKGKRYKEPAALAA